MADATTEKENEGEVIDPMAGDAPSSNTSLSSLTGSTMAEETKELKGDGAVEAPKVYDAQSADSGHTSSHSSAPAFPTLSVNIWPPTQRTRNAVIDRLVENLSTPSILSKRYDTIPRDEAAEIARRIEQEAFEHASALAPPAPTEGRHGPLEESLDGEIEILQIYSKEISRRILDSVKARASVARVPPAEGNATSASTESSNAGDSIPKHPASAVDQNSLGENPRS
ncbi:hypothetical protein HPP92_004193 [Vanilla planifolia]|nr:hypothetical protein HPP92_004193 [Vanilla planifolia]